MILASAIAVHGTSSIAFQYIQLNADQKTGYTFDRLNKSDAALLVVDHQIGLSQIVRDYDPTVFRQSLLGHAALGNLFNLPTILTTSAEQGPNNALPEEIIAVGNESP